MNRSYNKQSQILLSRPKTNLQSDTNNSYSVPGEMTDPISRRSSPDKSIKEN